MATSQTNSSKPRLFVLDYGAGNVRSLANSISRLGYEFEWIESVEDFDKADVSFEEWRGRERSRGENGEGGRKEKGRGQDL